MIKKSEPYFFEYNKKTITQKIKNRFRGKIFAMIFLKWYARNFFKKKAETERYSRQKH